MKSIRMILFIVMIYSTPTLAQSVTAHDRIEHSAEGLTGSAMIISSLDDEVSIRVHRLPNAQVANSAPDRNDLMSSESLNKMAIVIHR